MIRILKELGAGVLIVAVALYTGFIAYEPLVTSAVGEQFIVTQTISAEIAFVLAPTDVAMSPSIGGLTGGTANGGTQVRVRTNNSSGYTMTLAASSSLGMVGDTQGDVIPALSPSSAGVPDYSFDSGTVAANTAAFAYTVEASSTTDLDPSFRDSGVACNTGANDTADKCWLNAGTVPETIINRSTETEASGSTSTIKFRVVVQPNPSPSLTEDTYTATSTLTATMN